MDSKLLDEVISDSLVLERIFEEKKRVAFVERFLESLDIIDENGTVVGQAPRGLAHRVGLRHRTVYVMIIAPDGKLLLQQRAAGAGSSERRLDISVGGHVRAGEIDMKQSLCREMEEELGLTPELSKLRLVKEYNRNSPASSERPHERNRERRVLFEYVMDPSEVSVLNNNFQQRFSKSEVGGFGWFTAEQVASAIDEGRSADGLGTNFVHWLQR